MFDLEVSEDHLKESGDTQWFVDEVSINRWNASLNKLKILGVRFPRFPASLGAFR